MFSELEMHCSVNSEFTHDGVCKSEQNFQFAASIKLYKYVHEKCEGVGVWDSLFA